MQIPITEERVRLQEALWAGEFRNSDRIMVVERRCPITDQAYRCAEYLFDTLGEASIRDLLKDPATERLFWREVPGHLQAVGYAETDSPLARSIACYFEYKAFADAERCVHVGMVLTSGKVRSKFGPGDVYDHDLDAVPACFGQRVAFFRKR